MLKIPVDDLSGTVLDEADLVNLRYRAGLTATEVAAHLGIHKSALSVIENGYRRLPQQSAVRLGHLYQRSYAVIAAAWELRRADMTRRARI